MAYKILLDSPSDQPSLGFDRYATSLRQIIEESEPQFAIGIFGGWGSGKTTLMRAIQRNLSPQVVSVWFNAWRYEKEEHLIIPLLDTLRDALVEWTKRPTTDPTIKDKAIKVASTIAKAARAILVGVTLKAKVPLLPSSPELTLDANKVVAEWRQGSTEDDRDDAERPQSSYHASFKALQECFAEFVHYDKESSGDAKNVAPSARPNVQHPAMPSRESGIPKQRIVVFVDDLDRCLPLNALQILESMKLFFDLEGFIFVVGLDQDVVEAAVDAKYRLAQPSDSKASHVISGSEYIKKIFQVPFSLPPVLPRQLDQYLSSIYESDVDGSTDQIRPHLDVIVGDSGVNPREIKRYINAYLLQKMIGPELDDDAILTLQTISFRSDWQDAYDILLLKREAFTEAVKREMNGEKGALAGLSARLADVPDSFLQYIKSDMGQKLLGLDASQLEQHVRAFEATQSPETSLKKLDDDLRSMRQILSEVEPGNPNAANKLRERLRELESTVSSYYLREVNPNLSNDVEESLRKLSDLADLLRFMTLKEPGDLGTDDYKEIMRNRGQIETILSGLRELLRSVFK